MFNAGQRLCITINRQHHEATISKVDGVSTTTTGKIENLAPRNNQVSVPSNPRRSGF
jgi:hypothetical protein